MATIWSCPFNVQLNLTIILMCTAWNIIPTSNVSGTYQASYLTAMSADKMSMSLQYEHYAFLRDSDKMDLLLRYMTGIEVFTFCLPTNVSLLNR